YGIVPGKVTWISPDTKVTQTPQGNVENFELDIALDRQYIQNGNKRIPLTAGQTATAEVIIRQRRVIDFVLDPFKKLHKDGLEL
ncbi:MAG: HlyD family secretion protein, partial [Fischerella sp.]|nr:HlyD family secretion protein [Fischerella sp.]